MWVSIVDKDGHLRRVFTLNTVNVILLLIICFRSYLYQLLICSVWNYCQQENKILARAASFPAVSGRGDRSFVIVDDRKIMRSRTSKILLYSQPRSGSSFLGEIFNMQENTFYLYEPLHAQRIFAKSGVIPLKLYNPLTIRFLQDVLNCEIENYRDFLNFISHPGLSNSHYRLMSRVLASPPFCTVRVAANASKEYYSEHCTNLNPKLLSEYCARHDVVVVKDLMHRLPEKSITGLLSLLAEDDIHVICLIRDPRAVLWSMKHLGWFGKHYGAFAPDVPSAANTICSLFSSNIHAMERYANFLPNLIVIRYEDLVSRPTAIVSELFANLNLHIDERTVSWLLQNTHGQLDNLDLYEAYTVSLRNASHSLNYWRTVISMADVLLVQTLCGDVMSRLGYSLFWTRGELLDLSNSAFHDDFISHHVLKTES